MPQRSRSLHLPVRILQVYREALMGFSPLFQLRWSQQHIALLSLHPWNRFLVWEQWIQRKFQAQERRWGASDCPCQAQGSAGSHVLSMTSSNRVGLIQSTEGLKWKRLRFPSGRRNSSSRLSSDSTLQHQLFPGPPACWPTLQISDLPASTIMWVNSLKSLSHFFSLHPVGSFFLENID